MSLSTAEIPRSRRQREAASGAEPNGDWTALRARFVDAVERTEGAPAAGVARCEGAARTACAAVVKALYEVCAVDDPDGHERWSEPEPFARSHLEELAGEAADHLRRLPVAESAYLVGTLYTALLPPRIRAARGAYYTPPVLADRLLDLAEQAGVDWTGARVLDPACGGGAFLVPVASRMLAALDGRGFSSHAALASIEERLAGVEIDPFAAWMTRSFLQLALQPLSEAVGRAVAVSLEVTNALRLVLEDSRTFDLVVGNPPYGLEVDVRSTLPDLVLVDTGAEPLLLVFVECVVSDGPVDDRRHRDLVGLAQASGISASDCAFVTVFHDRAESVYRQMASALSWGTFVWFATEPDQIVHLRHGGEAATRATLHSLLGRA